MNLNDFYTELAKAVEASKDPTGKSIGFMSATDTTVELDFVKNVTIEKEEGMKKK